MDSIKDFQHAESDVVVAFTYNGNREKMYIIGKEDLLEPLNCAALLGFFDSIKLIAFHTRGRG